MGWGYQDNQGKDTIKIKIKITTIIKEKDF